MAKIFGHLGYLLVAIALAATVALVFPATAQQQPNAFNPTASAATEQQLLNDLRQIQGRGTIPDVKSYVIEQPAGREWRSFHEVYLRWIGGIAIFTILSLLVLFYLWRGPLDFARWPIEPHDAAVHGV
jgi:formate dehydrogenase subunit gamma